MEEPLVRGVRSVGRVPQPRYHVGQHVFGRHGATGEYFSGKVLRIDHEQVFSFVVDAGGAEPLHLLPGEIQSDLPPGEATPDDIRAWLGIDLPD